MPRRVWTRRVLLAGRRVVVPSLTLRRIATETWKLRRVDYLPNGIDLARFAGGPRAAWPGDGLVVGTVAALRAEKNLGRLLRAFAHATADGSGGAVGSARLVIVGDGPERPALEGLASQLGVAGRVVFAGHMADPAAALRSFDVFALSSDTEQMPISLLEAMAASLPVAATAVGDVAAILPAEAGVTVVPCDDAALGRALALLLRDAPLRRALAAANRARVEAEYGQARMLDGWAAVFDGRAIPAR